MPASGYVFAILALLNVAIAAETRAAPPSRPALAACGGARINRGSGLIDRRQVSRDLDAKIEDFLNKADATPGAAIVIVRGDHVVYARGYGFSNLESCKKVSPDTRFYLKSTTKSFLGAAAAVLQEEGAIELDAPISDYLPDLHFPDGLNPEQTSIRSHLVHTQPYFDSGLNFRTAFPGNIAEKEYVAHVNRFAQAKDIRFRYSNFGPIMAALAIRAKTSLDWRQFIQQKVLQPAGMRDSFTSMAAAKSDAMAVAYLGGAGETYRPTSTKSDSQMHAAGGLVSTAHDLGRWLIVNLNDGVVDGAQAIPKRAVEQAQSPQVDLTADYSEYHRFAYGLGLYFADYDGDLLVHDFGGETHLSFMPEHNLGVAVLSNEIAFGSAVTHRLASTIYDILLDKPDLDARIERRLEEIADVKARYRRRRQQDIAQRKAAVAGKPQTVVAADIPGKYLSDRLGEISIARSGGGLQAKFGVLTGPLTHLGGDDYLADINMWGAEPDVFAFRRGEECSGLMLDWGGRIFCRPSQ